MCKGSEQKGRAPHSSCSPDLHQPPSAKLLGQAGAAINGSGSGATSHGFESHFALTGCEIMWK